MVIVFKEELQQQWVCYLVAGMLHIAMTELFFHQYQYNRLQDDLSYKECTEGAFCEQYKIKESDNQSLFANVFLV